MKLVHLVRDAAVFAPCYVVLDWASYIDPLGPFNITPWNPQSALALAWLVLGGLANAPAVLATIMLAEIVVRDAPGGVAVSTLLAAILAFGYAAIAFGVRRYLKNAALKTTRELTLFAMLVVAGTCAVSAIFIGVLAIAGHLPRGEFAEGWLKFWIGDAVGILVTAPLLFAAADDRRRAALLALARRPEALFQAAALAATVWLIFRGLGNDPSRHFYLLFLPLIWSAVRFGLNGAVVAIAIVQMAVVVGIHGTADAALPVLELQALIAALSLTGLFLGVTVDQREAAEQNLRDSLRLAAAGEMAGAVAHEVNQPLTALANYAAAARTVLSGPKADAVRAREIVTLLQREADRAGEIVKRLRDFFRSGTTRLAPLEPAALADTLRRLGGQAVSGSAIRFDLEIPPDAPALLVDRLQIEVVIRNLLANAVESILGAGIADGRVTVRLAAQPRELLIVVSDNGPGIPRDSRHAAFEPFVSGKSAGMGLGLAISRTIAEAHGGSLEISDTPASEFHLRLPCTAAH